MLVSGQARGEESGASAMSQLTLLVISDIHHAGAAEQLRKDFQWGAVQNPFRKGLAKFYYRHLWLRDPFAHNALLDTFLAHPGPVDHVVANGDFSADSAFLGLADDAALASAGECLGKLRGRFAGKFHATIGDHELGKTALFGGHGGMSLKSWQRATEDLALKPFWQVELGQYTLMGVTSSLLALPVYERDLAPAENPAWQQLRAAHRAEICRAFAALAPDRRVLLFCHDPTALPFLREEEIIRARMTQIEQTIVGHLHTNLVFQVGRLLAGMPVVHCLGNSVARMTAGLNRARLWKKFRVRLCPSPPGVELLKDGGYFAVKLDSEARHPAQFHFHRLTWK